MTVNASVLVTPIMPAENGSGSAIRAWHWLKELAEQGPVWVITPEDASLPNHELAVAHASLLSFRPKFRSPLVFWRLEQLSISNKELHTLKVRLNSAIQNQQAPVRVVIFKASAEPLAKQLFNNANRWYCELDLDDDETTARWSLCRCALYLKKPASALFYAVTAIQHWRRERQWHQYHTVYVAAPEDTKRLSKRLTTDVSVKPNPFEFAQDREKANPHVSETSCFTCLFVGTLNYLPNLEAIQRVILPLAEQFVDQPQFQFVIAGRNPPSKLVHTLRAFPNIRLEANRKDLSALYHEARVVLVPIFSGGGTKIKTLEALAYGKDIISTPHGLRGLGQTMASNVLTAETADAFAERLLGLAKKITHT